MPRQKTWDKPQDTRAIFSHLWGWRRVHNCPWVGVWSSAYLANRELIDAYLKEGEAEFEKLQQSFREKNPLLYQKLKAAQNPYHI